MDPNTATYNGNKYLLGLVENGSWWFPNRRFIITESISDNTKELFGQFLSSSWLNKFYKKGSDIHLSIFCVKQNILHKELQKTLNNNQIIYEKCWTVYLDKDKINEKLKDCKLYESCQIEIKNEDVQIFFKLFKSKTPDCDEGFCLTIPEFIVKV